MSATTINEAVAVLADAVRRAADAAGEVAAQLDEADEPSDDVQSRADRLDQVASELENLYVDGLDACAVCGGDAPADCPGCRGTGEADDHPVGEAVATAVVTEVADAMRGLPDR